MINRAYKVRLYPTFKQKKVIDQTIGNCRFIYNQTLAEKSKFYAENKDNKELLKTHKYKTEKEYKNEFGFLKLGSSRALQQARRDLTTAYNNFFRNKKGYPKFKSKHKSHLSYREPQVLNQIQVSGNKLKLLKLGMVRFRGLSKSFNGKIKSVTVSNDRNGKYFASILVEQAEFIRPRKADNKVGIDLGLKEFVTLSDGQQIKPVELKEINSKIKKQQRHLSRKVKGSRRRDKCRIKLNKLHKRKVYIQDNSFNVQVLNIYNLVFITNVIC
jgi:putative transposase